MGKRFKILLILLLLNLPLFSQTDTSKVILPYHIAKLIAIDLAKGDSIKAELKETQNILLVSRNKIKAQDTVIVSLEKDVMLKQSEINVLGEKEKTHKKNIEDLEKENIDIKNKNNTLRTTSQILGGGLIGTLSILFTIFYFK